ncbi:hypothetical protein GW17_00006864 [Ensete ventricosum]|nr:hypothetical protein GW17_00006864 [Ensete ventricosum]
MIELWLDEAGLSPAPRDTLFFWSSFIASIVEFSMSYPIGRNADTMNLAGLRGMPKVPTRKPGLTAWAAVSSPEVQEVSAEVAPRGAIAPTPKRPIEGSTPHLKGKEPTASGGEPAQPAYRCSKSMKEFFSTIVHKNDMGYYALQMTDLPPRDLGLAMQAWWETLKNSTRLSDKELNDAPADLCDAQRQLKEQRAGRRKVDDDLLKVIKELEAQRADLPRQAIEDYKESIGFKLGLHRIGRLSGKELNDAPTDLCDAQRQLMEQRAGRRKVDGELLKVIKELGAQRADLPKQAIEGYKESTGFKLGLQRIGRVSYEYGYRACTWTLRWKKTRSPFGPRTIQC